MMTDPIARLDHHQIEAQRQVREQRPIGQRAALQQAVCGGSHAEPFSSVDGLFRQAEGTAGAPANLHRYKHVRRAGIHCNQVQLIPPDVDVPAEDRPSGGYQTVGDQLLSRIS